MSVPRFAVIAFSGISPFHLAVPILVFGEDRRGLGMPRFPFIVCAVEEGMTPTSGGYTIHVGADQASLSDADIIIVPGWRDVDEKPPVALLDALKSAHQRGATVVGLCLGTFVLAAAGLLEDRPATTHWAYAEALAARYPATLVRPSDLYVDDGDVITSAGVAAGLDCCLHLLRRLCGAAIAARVARHIVVPPHREGGQAQFIEQTPPRDRASDSFTKVIEAVQREPALLYTIDELASRAALSRRTFTRRFRGRMGATFLQWLTQQRLALAQQALETTDRSIEIIAHDTGFGSALSLRQAFRLALRTSPAAYRKAFRM